MPENIVPSSGLYDIAFYASAWLVGAMCGLLATFISNRDRHTSVDCWDLLSIGSLSGFISVAVIGVVVRTSGGTVGSEPYYIAISIACGLLGKNGLKLAYYIVGKLLEKIGVENGVSEVQAVDNDRDAGSSGPVDDSRGVHSGRPAARGPRRVDSGDESLGRRDEAGDGGSEAR